MKKLAFAEKELDKYWRLFKKAPKPYVRVRALGIILVAKGYSYRKIAGFLCVRPNTVCNWVKRVRTDEEPALANKQGRGRKCKIDVEAVIDTVKQSPMKFGLDESRWTISLLKAACPGLSNMTDSGVWRLLKRVGISWKRGQHKLTSPDPDYIEKKNFIKELVKKAIVPNANFRVLYIDEASIYRQPTVANTWYVKGTKCPTAQLSHRSNTKIRIAGALDVKDGRVHYQISNKCGVKELKKFWKSLQDKYSEEKIYLVMDNWPVHFNEGIWSELNKYGRLKEVKLPTYSPWLNPIEKVWRYLRQHLTHMHNMSDNLDLLKSKISLILEPHSSGSQEILKYSGLCIK